MVWGWRGGAAGVPVGDARVAPARVSTTATAVAVVATTTVVAVAVVAAVSWGGAARWGTPSGCLSPVWRGCCMCSRPGVTGV